MANEKTKSELAEEDRNKIEVTSTNDKEEVEKEENAETDENDKSGEEDNSETDKEVEKEGEETEEIEEEKKEEKSPEILKLEKTIERLKGRVSKTSAERDANKTALAEAKAALEAKKVEGDLVLDEAEVERRSEIKANDKAAFAAMQRDADKLLADGVKEDKDFQVKVDAMAEDIGKIPGALVAALAESDNGGAVLNYLTDNIEEAQELYDLAAKGSFVRLGLKISKLSDKIEKEKKPKPKEISKVPNPGKPVSGNQSKSPNVLTGKENMDEFIRIRNAQSEERRKAKMR